MKIKDIARKAGVSTATVSNVINGNRHKVSQATIDKVQGIIAEMGYRPSATARSLASKESKIIGVVIPNLGEEESFDVNLYMSQVIALLEKYVRREGYYLMLRSVGQCKEIVPIFSGWNVDGVVFLGAHYTEVEEIEGLLKVPTIYADTYAQDLEIANVGVDDYKGGLLMGRYLLGKGHRRIAFAGPSVANPGVVQERYHGLCAALKEQGLEMDPELMFEANTGEDRGIEAGKRIAASGRDITAVAAMSDTLALGIVAGLRQCGIRVPEDVSVMGFDNLNVCNYSNPPITTIAQDIEEKVQRIGKHLFHMIRSKDKVSVNEVLDVAVVERRSVRDLSE